MRDKQKLFKPMTQPEMIFKALGENGGLTMNEIAQAIGIEKSAFNAAFQRLRKNGLVHKIDANPKPLYYPTINAMEAARPAVTAATAAYREMMYTVKKKRSNDHRKNKNPQNEMGSGVWRRRSDDASSKDLPMRAVTAMEKKTRGIKSPALPAQVVMPDHVKIQRATTPRPRFEPEPGFVGQFTSLGIGRYE